MTGPTAARRAASRLAAALAAVALLAAALAVAGPAPLAGALPGLVRTGAFSAPYGGDGLLVILAIGSDKGPPHRPGDPTTGLADGIHLFAIDPATARMTVVDIPRDSAIGGRKVNAHLALGGIDRLRAEVQAWSGLQIDHHVLGSFQTVEAVTARLGGIPLDIPHRMHDPFSGTDLHPGVQVLGPGQALAFARDRKSLADGDIGRSANQTRLMLAGLSRVRELVAGDPQHLMDVVATVRQHTESDIPAHQLVPLALLAMRIQPEGIEHVTISGPFGTIAGGSVIVPQPGDVFARLTSGQVGPR